MKWMPWLCLSLFALFLVAGNRSAELGLIDDHEIAMFLGPDGRIGLSELPKTILGTEVGQWGAYPRYRPSYYTLRVIETALWRDRAVLWYASRYAMLCVSLFLGWRLLCRHFPRTIACLFVLYAMTLPFWPDLLTRLGPSETYAVPALLLCVSGMIENRLWMLTLGYTMCVGSKENFLFLFPLLLAWAGYKAARRELPVTSLIATSLMTAYTLAIVGAIVVATGKTGTDFYATPISYRSRVGTFIHNIPELIGERNMLPALLAMLGGAALSLRLWKREGWRRVTASPVARHVALMGALLAAIASQYIFYANRVPAGMRYGFPCMLLFPLLDLAAFSLIIAQFRDHRLGRPIALMLHAGIAMICVVDVYRTGYARIRTHAAHNAVVTQAFAVQLEKATRAMRDNPDAWIVFVSRQYFDFEPIVSVVRYLDARGVRNPLALHFTPVSGLRDPLGNELQDQLMRVMRGDAGIQGSLGRFSPYERAERPCYCLTFRDAPGLPHGPVIATF